MKRIHARKHVDDFFVSTEYKFLITKHFEILFVRNVVRLSVACCLVVDTIHTQDCCFGKKLSEGKNIHLVYHHSDITGIFFSCPSFFQGVYQLKVERNAQFFR